MLSWLLIRFVARTARPTDTAHCRAKRGLAVTCNSRKSCGGFGQLTTNLASF